LSSHQLFQHTKSFSTSCKDKTAFAIFQLLLHINMQVTMEHQTSSQTDHTPSPSTSKIVSALAISHLWNHI